MVTTIDELKATLQQVVDDNGLKKFRTRHWERIKASLDYLNAQVELFVITSTPGPNVAFVELENDGGFSVGDVPYTPDPRRSDLWRLGPFLALGKTNGSKSASEAPAPPVKSARKDDAIRKPAPASRRGSRSA